jgi:rhamnogalacturonyl hydrolase YesR
MLQHADESGNHECIHQAHQMTTRELSIQLVDGGFQGGNLGPHPIVSSTFVAGQVLFGLVAAYERFREDSIRAGAIRAGEFLLQSLDETGRFVRGYSHFCAPRAKAYDARTGLALAKLSDMVNDQRFRAAAIRIADYALSTQHANGWFRENDLGDLNR